MSFARTFSAQTTFLRAHIVSVEVDISRGLNAFSIVGLPDKAVEEARDRIGAAIKNAGFESPKHSNQKTVIALAPADLKKEGPLFDVAMALAYLLAKNAVRFEPKDKLFLGELSLDGELRPIRGALALARKAHDEGFREIYVPAENAREAALIDGIAVFGARTLTDIIVHLDEKQREEATETALRQQEKTKVVYERPETTIDMADVRGQESAKRGLEIAAAGGHNVAMYGPPGTGKTMLARAFTNLLPPLPFDEVLETTGIHSVAGTLESDLVTHPPLRAPHHTSSYVSLVGGGAVPKPGEVTLAHRGVLFLDEFPEFDRRVIEALRQPLEDRVVSVSRAKGSARFPADFILVAAMNPCPCGNFGSEKSCVCPPARLDHYRRKLSGPIVDRIDLWTEVGTVEHEKLGKRGGGETSERIRERIEGARKRQAERFANTPLSLNSQMGVKELERFAPLTDDVREIINISAKRLGLSARAYHRLIKLARTIADLAAAETIGEEHILEALQYRPKQML